MYGKTIPPLVPYGYGYYITPQAQYPVAYHSGYGQVFNKTAYQMPVPYQGNMATGQYYGYGYGQQSSAVMNYPKEKESAKALKKESLRQQHQWQQGYSFGQDSGMFPDYYNTNY